ncbi:MAG TPA: glycerate kinase [Tepidisphaeraceae bacterium]|nr:glycerate kinase [Tepidisphaeraceae bacterium]
MKIVLAPDKFKGCLSAAAVCEAMAASIRAVDASIAIDACPMADGGEGTVDALVAATGGRTVTRRVTGPLPGTKVEAPIGLLGDGHTAVIEMAAASGLHLLRPEQYDPTRTTTYGTGELLVAAAELGVKRIILGIGGSATIDGGIGAAQAWGARFVLRTGQSYSAGDRRLTGGDLKQLLRFDWPGASKQPAGANVKLLGSATVTASVPHYEPLLNTRGIEFIVACDVGNPLFGPDGAAPIFGPQKGATSEQITELDSGLRSLAEKLLRTPLADAPGAGAAGGMGFGMMAFFGATLRPGAAIVMEATNLRERLRDADLCLTGEGKLDVQSLGGKTAVAVARICKELNVPCIALTGSLAPGHERAHDQGLTAAFSICPGPMTLEESLHSAAPLLSDATTRVLRTFTAPARPRG